MRITKPGKLGKGVKCGEKQCGHRYSSAQAWNADQSLLLLASGCGGYCFLDGRTYQPVFFRTSERECEWIPREPEKMICVGAKDVVIWNPREDVEEAVFSAQEYDSLKFGPGKGNPSKDGTRIAVRASRNGMPVAFAFDINEKRKFPDIDLSKIPGENNYCSITPSGDYVACIQTATSKAQNMYIFDVEGKPVQSWLENHRPGHGDFVIDTDGLEYAVGISKSHPDKYHVIKRQIIDGTVSKLMKYGEATHISARAIDSDGWIVASYEGDPVEVGNHPKWAQFAREVVLIAMDGSGEARVIAQTYNDKVDYQSETHASPSPDGNQIIWSSNWGVAGGPVYDFVTQVSRGNN